MPTPALDYQRTARRPGWAELPSEVRAAVIGRVGTITDVIVAGGGFTPAFAAAMTTSSGDRFFLKAADLGTEFGQAIEREAAILALLPPGLPVPHLEWSATLAGWSVSCLDPIDGRMPGQPWTAPDLALVLDAHAALAGALATPSAELVNAANERSFSVHSAMHVDTRRRVHDGAQPLPDAPLVPDHLTELIGLEAILPLVTAGATSLMHFDLRPDNVLIPEPAERAVVLDWNWIRPGPAWVDTVMLLTTAAGQHDTDALLAAHPTSADVPADHIDAVLAGLGGAMLEAGDRARAHVAIPSGSSTPPRSAGTRLARPPS